MPDSFDFFPSHESHQKKLVSRILPENLRGKTVLDVRSHLGYFCFEALKRGAERVVGLESSRERVRQAQALARKAGMSVEFHHLDIETEIPNETFDIVLGLNVLYRLRNPINVLDKLASLTREKLILEVAGVGEWKSAKSGFFRRQYRLPDTYPAITIGRDKTSFAQWRFYISPAALQDLLLYHRNHFARLDIIEAEPKGRYLAVAHRRRVNRLVVIAGPTSVGKSTLIKRLLNDQLPEIASKLELGPVAAWQFAGAGRLRRLQHPHIDRLLFHYDFLRPYDRSDRGNESDEALDILAAAQDITFVTLWAEPSVLRQRLMESEIAPYCAHTRLQHLLRQVHLPAFIVKRLRKHMSAYPILRRIPKVLLWPGPSDRHTRIYEMYCETEPLLTHYKDWFRFCDRYTGCAHWIIDLTQHPFLYPRSDWEALEQKYHRDSSSRDIAACEEGG